MPSPVGRFDSFACLVILVVQDWFFGPRRQGHSALCDVAHELSVVLWCAHAHTPLWTEQTLLVMDITIGSAAP